MTELEQYQIWLTHAKGAALDELRAVAGDKSELHRRFGTEPKFGTAGIRCQMGAGSSLLNEYTVRRVARGLAACLHKGGEPLRCAIGYDSRNNSKRFAEICAAALAAEEIEVWLFDRLCPTPMLSFAVRELRCGAGMVVSASHNTKEYNGLKCYGPDGCQMTDDPADTVAREMARLDLFEPEKESFDSLLAAGKIRFIESSLWEAYYKSVSRELLQPRLIGEAQLRIVYSPLCGAGGEPVAEMLTRLGAQVFTPPSQKEPSGEFATCPVPNPEKEAAFAESYALADSAQPDLILVTDPDSDRIAAAVKTPDGYRKFTGNEMGCLLLDYILRTLSVESLLPPHPVAVMSIVSTPMAKKIAEACGCEMCVTPTGFKHIGAAILELEGQSRPFDFVFGFEESCGYLKGTYCRDKDAVAAACLIAELAAEAKLRGSSLDREMELLYAQYGYVVTRLEDVAFPDDAARAEGLRKLHSLGETPPEALGAVPVDAVTDFSAGRRRLPDKTVQRIDFPLETMVRLELAGGSTVILRPSGTEPKMKIYYTAVSGLSAADAEKMAGDMRRGMDALLGL